MPDDFRSLREKLLKHPNYVPNHTLITGSGWKQAGSRHILVNKTNSELQPLIIVGRVLDSFPNLRPCGNFTRKFPLKQAKFQFSLCRPDDLVFAGDWNRSMKMMQDLQNIIAGTKYHRNFLSVNNKQVNMRFSAEIWSLLLMNDSIFACTNKTLLACECEMGLGAIDLYKTPKYASYT
jgi:hypothetical protein